ncbi:sulfur metabolite repression control protein [Arthroderma uncinatum]|uniref:sulfur metabolite repression control protein n=1 Tax=Arthroderma uncinatum TaxID=74035 RepID=UPI00144AC985|nr:sulfur metabolite repression control protein [Arthroderma uncinatum]KAF3481400.1 sulfur metabolite repression control protein [Arthroderma uncinatum]
MGHDQGAAAVGLQPRNYEALPPKSSFKIDEGYSDETKSLQENESVQDTLELPAWILSRSEADRADLAYTLLRTLRTSTISTVIDRLTPLLHMDPVYKLPPEITAEIFSYLDPTTLLTASLASKPWRSRILDSRLWRGLYIKEGWRLNMTAIRDFHTQSSEIAKQQQSRKSRNRISDTDSVQPQLKKRALACDRAGTSSAGAVSSTFGGPALHTDTEGDHEMRDAAPDSPMDVSSPTRLAARLAEKCNVPNSLDMSVRSPGFDSLFTDDRSPLPYSSAAVWSSNGPRLNWAYLYKQRQKLEENWRNGRFTNFQLPHPNFPWESHRERVYVIQFVGKWLVSGSRDKSVRVWDLETQRLRGQPLIGHTKSVLCLQFDPSPEEDIIISGSSDRSVVVWRFSTGEKIQELPNVHLDSVLNLRFDKRYLVTCSKDKTIKIFNRNALLPTDDDYPRVAKGAGPRYPSYIVDTSVIQPSTLEAQMANQQIKSLPPFTLLMTLDGHRAAVNAIQIDKDEIVSGSGDRLIKVWSIHSGACLKTLLGHNKGIACIQFDNQRIVSGSNDDTVRIYDHVSGAEVACLRGHSDLVRTVQAGFGDPPGSEETMRLEAMAVDHEYFEARRRGDVDENPITTRHSRRNPNTGSRLPQDVMALGAKIPPGGGGSIWARIVSGSYDESIIVWMRDKEGRWVIGQRLSQVEAAKAIRAAAAAAPAPDSFKPSAFTSFDAARSAASASSAETAQRNATSQPQPAAASASSSASIPTSIPPQQPVDRVNTPPLPVPAQVPHGQIDPAAQAHPNPQDAAAGVAPDNHGHQLPLPPTAGIFKVQFDARNLICASQDSRIIGWDFACGDKKLEEACQFFEGL